MSALRDARCVQTGFSMVEVLVALVILLVGLLGLAGLMAQSQRSELESYQRVQALILAKDMVARINANRNVAVNQTGCYGFTINPATGTPFLGSVTAAGAPPVVPVCAAIAGVTTNDQIAQANRDLREWNTMLQGTSESYAAGTAAAGAMVGARGCVSYNAAPYSNPGNPGGELLDFNGLPLPGTGLYTVEVVWQGTSATFAPPGLTCAKGMYGDDKLRRDLSLPFRLGSVNNTLAAHPYP